MTKDIIVDIGRFDKVDYVFVDGQKIVNYRIENYKLIIPYSSTKAINLTIGIIGEDGAMAVQTYQLKYSSDEGYTAVRMYGTNDLKKSSKPILDLLKKLFNKIVEWFKGLFKK